MAISKKKKRIALDMMLSALLVFEMLIQFTGEFLHEIMGFVFFGTVVAHLFLSRAWIKSTAKAAGKGKLSDARRGRAVVGTLLAAVMVVLVVSSIAISGILYDAGFVMPGPYEVWHVLHTASSYMLCAVVVAHLAMHWAMLAQAFRIPYSPARRSAIHSGVNAAAALAMIVLGVNGGRAMILGSQDDADGDLQDGSEATAAESTRTRASTNANSGESTLPETEISDAPSASMQPETPYTETPEDTYGKRQRGSKGHGRRNSANEQSLSESTDAYSANRQQSAEGAQGGSTQNSPSTQNSASGNSSPESDGAQEPQSASGAGSTSVICTLCRKYCSLSNPRCNKPYRAGLL